MNTIKTILKVDLILVSMYYMTQRLLKYIKTKTHLIKSQASVFSSLTFKEYLLVYN